MFHADTLYWKLELYSASSNYPLSQHLVLAGEERSYFKHAATALVNARTARVMIAADPSPDPIALAWMTRFPKFSRLPCAGHRPGAHDYSMGTGRLRASRRQATRLSGRQSLGCTMRMRAALARRQSQGVRHCL